MEQPNQGPKYRVLQGQIPWGYDVDEDDPALLKPNIKQLYYLDIAKSYIRSGEYSFREIASWLSKKTEREISHVTLYNLYHGRCSSAKKKKSKEAGESIATEDFRKI